MNHPISPLRQGNVLLVVVALSSLMLALTLALTMKVQSNLQTAFQIRKFTQAYLIAGPVHTRWPGMKLTPNTAARQISFLINFWDLAYDHVWPAHGTSGGFVTPPALLGYFLWEWRDVVWDKRVGLCVGGSKSTGYNDVGASGTPGMGWAYDCTLAFVCDEQGNFPSGAHLLTPADVTFPRSTAAAGLALRTGNQLSQVLPP